MLSIHSHRPFIFLAWAHFHQKCQKYILKVHWCHLLLLKASATCRDFHFDKMKYICREINGVLGWAGLGWAGLGWAGLAGLGWWPFQCGRIIYPPLPVPVVLMLPLLKKWNKWRLIKSLVNSHTGTIFAKKSIIIHNSFCFLYCLWI